MKAIIWLAGLVIAIAAAAALFAWSGAYNVAADEPHGSLTARALKATRARSVEVRAAGIDVPDLEREEMIRAGAGNYDAMCAACHLRPGLDGTPQSQGLNPAPPDLGHRGIDDPSVAFWTIKHGIRMTGMPAWGSHMGDE
jgi:mono/diheme cytochrome c family protein